MVAYANVFSLVLVSCHIYTNQVQYHMMLIFSRCQNFSMSFSKPGGKVHQFEVANVI
jgi:hypothetical protein